MLQPLLQRIGQFLVLLLCMLVCTSVQAADPIEGEDFCEAPLTRIEFSGNKKTRDRVMLDQLDYEAGDDCSLDHIIDGIQSIMDLGLFKRVVASLDSVDGDLVVNYDVVEKYYFFPIPRFSRTSDGELRLGAQLRWDNFRGLNHQIKLTSERREEDDGAGPSGQHHKFEYQIPRFFGSDFGFSTKLEYRRQSKVLEQDNIEFGEADSDDMVFKLQLLKWRNRKGVTQGSRMRFGVQVMQRSLDLVEGELGPFNDGLDIAFNFGYERRDVHDDLFRLRGSVAGVNFRFSTSTLGSETGYNRTDFYYRRFKPLSGLKLRNFNYQLRLGISDAGPFGERQYSLGGGEKLRGFKAGRRTGDILMLANLEYLVAFPQKQSLRYVFFGDVGNVYRHNDFNPLNQKFRVGTGIRWKLLSFSNTNLRIDAAWDSRKDNFRYYFSTDLTF